MTSNTRYVFVDGDSILFRATYGDNIKDSVMRERYTERLSYIRTHTFADELFVAVKGFGNFRQQIDPEYKSQRKELDEETKRRLNMIHAYAVEKGAIQSDGWEADDQVRAWSWEADNMGIQWVIAGIDKDLLQIPGTHFNYGGSEKKPLEEDKKWTFITPEEGDYRFACQLLTGDTIDNIKGITRVGPKKAEKALSGKSRKEMMETIMEMYKEEYKSGWEDRLHKNCNLIYMRRWLDDEFNYEDWLNG